MTNELTSGLIAAVLSAVHIWAGRLRFLDRTPRSVWLSAAGGIAVAYVFLHLLPELGAGQLHVSELQGSGWRERLENEVYLVALAGLSAFYGLERLAVRARVRQRRESGEDGTPAGAFALHIGAFALYNVLVGYLLLHGERDNIGAYAVAMGLHFVVNDHGLRQQHRARYDHVGRWLLAAAVFAGWWIGLRVEVSELAVALLTALLAGGVVLNVLKEELPEEGESRFAAFIAGAAVYGALLLAV